MRRAGSTSDGIWRQRVGTVRWSPWWFIVWFHWADTRPAGRTDAGRLAGPGADNCRGWIYCSSRRLARPIRAVLAWFIWTVNHIVPERSPLFSSENERLRGKTDGKTIPFLYVSVYSRISPLSTYRNWSILYNFVNGFSSGLVSKVNNLGLDKTVVNHPFLGICQSYDITHYDVYLWPLKRVSAICGHTKKILLNMIDANKSLTSCKQLCWVSDSRIWTLIPKFAEASIQKLYNVRDDHKLRFYKLGRSARRRIFAIGLGLLKLRLGFAIAENSNTKCTLVQLRPCTHAVRRVINI